MSEQPKQDTGKTGGETSEDNYTADEIAQESIYEDSTQVAQEIRRGSETNDEAANDRDAAGKADIKDWDQRQVQENKREE